MKYQPPTCIQSRLHSEHGWTWPGDSLCMERSKLNMSWVKAGNAAWGAAGGSPHVTFVWLMASWVMVTLNPHPVDRITDWQTDTAENITFPKISWRAVLRIFALNNHVVQIIQVIYMRASQYADKHPTAMQSSIESKELCQNYSISPVRQSFLYKQLNLYERKCNTISVMDSYLWLS